MLKLRVSKLNALKFVALNLNLLELNSLRLELLKINLLKQESAPAKCGEANLADALQNPHCFEPNRQIF